MRRLTVKLRGRAEAPALGAEGAQSPSARADKLQAPHGPLQRLLEAMRGGVNVSGTMAGQLPKTIGLLH